MTTKSYHVRRNSLTTPSWMFQATELKTWTQQLRHDHQRNQANQRQLQPFFIMSPSDLLATQSSEYLQERCPRHRHWETYENKTNLKQLTTCKQCYPASTFTQDTTQTQNWSQNLPFQDNSAPSCFTRHSPLLNSRLNSELRLHYVHRCSPHDILLRSEWTSSRSKRSKEKR